MDMDGYLAGLSAEARLALTALHDAIQTTAPDAKPGMSYGVPAFLLRGKPLVCFAAFENHYGFYPLSPGVIDAFADELARFSTAKGTVRFPRDQPLPLDLVQRMVKARLEEMRGREGD